MIKTLFRAGFVLLSGLLVAGVVGCGSGLPAGSSAASVTLSATALPGAVVGTAYTGKLGASGGVAPYSFSVDSGLMPAGFVMYPTGVISGTTSVVGTYNFVASVTDSLMQRSTAAVRIIVSPNGTITVVTLQTTNPAAGNVGTAYNGTIAASGGVAPYAFAVTGGTLPAGVSLTSAGVLTGTPATMGTYSFTVKVTDAISQTASATFNWTIAGAVVTPLSITTTALANGTVGTQYNSAVQATGGTAPYSFAVTTGSLPTGLTMSTAGAISGLPTAASAPQFTVTVTDAAAKTATQVLRLQVDPPANPLHFVTTSLPVAAVGVAYSTTVVAAGGFTPYSFTIPAGSSLPSGFTMTTAGVISGTFTAQGSATFNVLVTDALGETAVTSFTLSSRAPLTVTANGNPPAVVTQAYTNSFHAANGTAPYTFAVTSGSLPAGLTLTAAGVLSGTPTVAGPSSFTVTATDAAGAKASLLYQVSVLAEIGVSSSTALIGTVGVAFSSAVNVTNGVGPVTNAISGSLPPGITYGNFVFSGTPTQAGDTPFALVLSDGAGRTATVSYTFHVAAAAAPLALPVATLAAGQVGVGYSAAITATGGTTPYSYAVTANALPSGLVLGSNGTINGTPSASGTVTFGVTVTDAAGNHASQTFGITVAPSASPLAFVTTTLPAAQVGVTYTQTLAATGGSAPYSFAVTAGSLPGGFGLSSAGVLSGAFSAQGSGVFTVTVTDAIGSKANQTYTMATSAPLTVTQVATPNGVVNQAYSVAFTATNGTTPYSFAVTGGALPAGLTLGSNGVLSGTPTAAGTSNFSVTVTDGAGLHGSANFTVVIAPVAVSITTTTLPNAAVGFGYSAQINATNGVAPYTFGVTGGALPAGMTVSPVGAVYGTATTTGTYSFTVTVTDASGGTALVHLTMVVTPELSITTASFANGVVGTAYNAALAYQYGISPITFGVNGGALPAGLFLNNSTGAITGTPTTAGTAGFTLIVYSGDGQTAQKTFSMTVTGTTSGLVITSPATLGNGAVGATYDAPFFADGGTKPYTWAVTGGTLPTGMSFTPAGELSGTATAAGTFHFTLQVTDSVGGTASQAFMLFVAPSTALAITTPQPGAAYVGYAYAAPWYAAGGVAPYTFAVTNGALPTGMTFANAQLAGTPTVAGTYHFTVTVTDAIAETASVVYTLTVNPAGNVLVITTPQPGPAYVGYSYDAPWYAAGGTQPYTFAITAGSIPANMAFANGHLTGSPTLPGTVNFTVTVTDSVGATASQAYTLVVQKAGNPLQITTPPLGPGYVGASYTGYFYAAYGTQPYTFAVTAGAIPAGMTVTPAGVFSGVPTTEGTYNFTITVTDADAGTATQAYTLLVVGGQLVVASTTLPNGLLNTAYNSAIQILGGTGPYTASTMGTLPTGLTLSNAGVVSGTPTSAGAYTFPLVVTDSSTPVQTINVTMSLTVASPSTATVQVDMTKVLAVVPATAYGIHTSVYDANLNAAGPVAAAMAASGTTMMRFPGGGYSDSYHWAQHAITPLLSSTAPACGQRQNGYLYAGSGFGTFVKTMQAAGAQGMVTVNYGTSVADSTATVRYGSDGQKDCSDPNTYGQPQEAAAWVAYANGDPTSTQVIGKDMTGFDWKTVGFWATMRASQPLSVDDGYNFLRIGVTAPVGVKYWEIGNELYYGGWDSNRNIEDDLHAPYVFPNGYGGPMNSRAGVAGLSPTDYGTNSIAFIQAMKAVDPTIKIGVDLSSPQTDPIVLTWNPGVLQAVCAGNVTPDFAIFHYYPGTYQDVQAVEMLTLPQSDLPRLKTTLQQQMTQYCPAAVNPQVFLTETSPNGNVDSSVPTQVKGLYALNIFLSGLQAGIGNVNWLELHDGTYLDNQENPGWALYGIEMAHNAAGVGDSFVQATSSVSSVTAYATLKANGQKGIVLVNADPQNSTTVTVSVAGTTLGSSAVEYSYGVGTTQNGTTLSSVATSIAAGGTFNVTVPAYTAVVVVIP